MGLSGCLVCVCVAPDASHSAEVATFASIDGPMNASKGVQQLGTDWVAHWKYSIA